MKHRIILWSSALLAVLVSAFCACQKGGGPVEPDPTPGPVPEPEDTIENVLKTIDGYPEGVTLQYFEDYFEDGSKCSGYIATIDFNKNRNLVFNAVHLPDSKTPSATHLDFSSSDEKAIITTNGGYFWDGESLSLLIDDGQVKATASNYAYVIVREKTTTVYPVRAALGRKKDGSFEATWVYCCMNDNQKPYSFPSPLGNNEKTKTFLRSAPTSKTEGAVLWEPSEAIGGGPMLVMDGVNVAEENYWKEILDEGGTAGLSRQPRTALGATADGTLVILVCDGRGMNGSAGFTLSEVADKFISRGVDIAINLDGGGSSTMVGKDGKVLNRPSDSGEGSSVIERSVPTAVIISEKK